MMHLVQVCNVGEICGGTAACAWTVTRALPEWKHTVLCLGKPGPETMRVFHPVTIQRIRSLNETVLRPLKPDLLLLHNTGISHIECVPYCPSVQWLHSSGQRAHADVTVACSRWLAEQQASQVPVLYQPVPVPCRPRELEHRPDSRHLEDRLIIGRLCTPRPRKWPPECVDFYGNLAPRFPQVLWEFVGCPKDLRQSLQSACRGQARFLEAGWEARSHLWRWHAMLYHHPQITESFGRTAAEAMRAGCLPIVNRRGGFLEQVTDGQTGFLCGSTREFAAAIDEIRDLASWWRMARAARTEANQRFSLIGFPQRLRDCLKASTAG